MKAVSFYGITDANASVSVKYVDSGIWHIAIGDGEILCPSESVGALRRILNAISAIQRDESGEAVR